MKLAAAALLAACQSPIDITPIIDNPVDDPEAAITASDLDQIELEIAHAGNAGDLAQQTFPSGKTVEVGNVPLADDLVVHMTGKFAAADVAYGRTCVFPATAGESPHLFFSRSQHFGTLGVSPELRIGGTGFQFNDGSGLLIGGTSDGTMQVTDVERFKPQTGEWATIAQVAPRSDAVVTSVGTGAFQVVVIGGSDPMNANEPASFLELVDADAGTVTRLDDARIALAGMTATASSDGKVIAIGGREPGNVLSPFVYVLGLDTTGSIQIKQSRGVLSVPRTGDTATRLGDDVGAAILVAGGQDASGQPVALGELFKPLDDHFADPATFAPKMNVPRFGHTTVRLPDGSVLILGGYTDAAATTTTTVVERFSVDTGFVQLPANTLPPGAPTIDFTTSVLPDGRILIVGGEATVGGPPVTMAYIASLDTDDDTVNIIPTFSPGVTRSRPQSVLLCDGTVLVSGGTSTAMPAERYNPPATGRR